MTTGRIVIIIWLFLASIGFFISLFEWRDARRDAQYVLAQKWGEAWIVLSTGYVWNARNWLFVFLVFIIIGIVAIIPLRTIENWLLPVGLIVVEFFMVLNVGMRRRMIRRIRRDHKAS